MGGVFDRTAGVGIDTRMAVSHADHDHDLRRHGSYVHMDRHRVYLANLARRKAMEKEAAAVRDADRQLEEKLERGFNVCLNGANREWIGRPKTTERPNSAARLLRVPGALPIPTPLEVAERPEQVVRDLARAAQQQPPSRRGARGAEEQERKIRRRWVLGQAVLLKTAEGGVLQVDLPEVA